MDNGRFSFSRACAILLTILTALCLSISNPAYAAKNKQFVRKAVGRIKTGSSVIATFAKPNNSGHLLVAYVVWDNTDAVTISDSAGNTYTSAIGPTTNGGQSSQVFFAANVNGGSNTVTASFATAIASRGALYVAEYSGIDPAAPLDTAVVATGAAPDMDSGPLITGTANELLFVGAESDVKVTGKAPNFKVRSHKFGGLIADRLAGAAGSYNVTSTQKGASWIIQLVAFKSVGSNPNTAYPLKVSANGRYLVDQNNVPFLLTGDSPQALMVNLSEADADFFFADRQAAGFNAAWINLLCSTYTGGRPDASTYDGIVPFTTPGDLSTPNEAYFTRIDHMLQLAAQHGIVVFLDPAETGSFLTVLNSNGVTKSRDYGRYLGNRYRSFDNVVWMSGNDFQSWENAGDDAVVQAVAQGIRDNDDRHIHTVELDYLVSGSLDDPTWRPFIELNASYTYYPTYAQVLTDYNRSNPLPTFMVEANYEFEHNAADEGTPEILRRQEYWTLLSGAAGQLYGNHYTWPFIDGWQDNFDTPGSQQMGYTKALFQSRAWYNLVPDQNHTVVTAGFGTYADTGSLGANDYLTAARTPDGSLVMAYMPTLRTITVDMSSLASQAYAYWYDPSIGALSQIVGSPFANSGSRDFDPPGTNNAGDGDWVLVLETSSPAVPKKH